MDAYLAAKKKLFDNLKDTAVAITNADDENGRTMVRDTIANVHSYGIRTNDSARADLMAYDLERSANGTKFGIEKRYSNERAICHSPLVGDINVENVLAAASALYFGVEGFSLDAIAGFIPKLQAPRGRFERIALSNGASAIVDYAHTPDALENVLKTIRAVMKEGQIMTVFGCGGDRDKGKRPQMGAITASLSDKVIVTSDNPRSENPFTIIEEIVAGVPASHRSKIQTEPDRAKAIILAISMAKAGDVVLLAGKGHENYQIIGTEKHHFDDREEVLKYNALQ
jgi:UDP-N-acetylmuramoyl-L-alanyl-D-glutamate--2,6-diaminopimelate ligase